MISLKIENVKDFMKALFFSDMFDRFQVMDVEVKMMFTTNISGRVNSGWFSEEEAREQNVGEYVHWNTCKEQIYSLIKGNRTPLRMNINYIFVMENGDVGSVKILYDEKELRMMTGYSDHTFTMDRTRQGQWDDNNKAFLKKHEIIFVEE